MKKIKISAVSYLNTLPFIYGLEQNKTLFEQVELSKDIPSECARKLLSDEVDLGLIPVAVIPELEEYHIVSDYCIGAVGAVMSVLLLSDVPLEEIDQIYLDYQSRTSVKLCQVLCKNHWKINPDFVQAKQGYEAEFGGNSAAVIIGDRTFKLSRNYKYHYDLSEEWKKMTGLPFVFAAWVSNKKLSDEFLTQFNTALKLGVENIDLVLEKENAFSIPNQKLLDYLNTNISYSLDALKKQALNLFLDKLETLNTINLRNSI